MKLDIDRDIPIIAEKGFELARELLTPNSFYSLAVRQKKGEFGSFEFDEKTGKLTLPTSSKVIRVNPNKVTEQGVAVCKSSKGNINFKEGGRKGIAMKILPEMCGEDSYIGSLHTHPGGNPVPSVGDLGASSNNNDQVMCIATRLDKHRLGVNCYIPKTDWLPEEITAMDSNVRDILKDLEDQSLNVKLNKNVLAKIPVYDNQKIKWFSGAMIDEIRHFYEIKIFERKI